MGHFPLKVESAGRTRRRLREWPTDTGRPPVPPGFQTGLEASLLNASRQSAGTHLSAMTQNSLHGGKPVYSTSNSKLQPVGNRSPDSHVLTVEMETPKSLAIVLSVMLFFRRQLLKAIAKLARTSQ